MTDEPLGAVEIPGASEAEQPLSRRLLRRTFVWVPITALLIVMSCAAVFMTNRSVDAEFLAARRAVRIGDWPQVKLRLNRYLWWHPNSVEGRMLMAEACIKAEDTSDTAAAAHQARLHLQLIEGSPQQLALARLQEARLAWLLQRSPTMAEELLRQSLTFDDNLAESHVLMWHLLDLTGRHVLSDEHFWRAYDLSPPAAQTRLIRDWFLSEFYPNDLHGTLFSQLGITAVNSIPASINLLVHFRETEPQSPVIHAALAAYYRQLGNLKATIDLLKESQNSAASMQDQFFVSVLFEALIDLGEFSKAEETFNRFPQPHDGFLYWRCASLYYDYIHEDNEQSLHCFRKAMTYPPAKLDWGLMNRMAACMRKLGMIEEADKLQRRVERLSQEILTTEHTSMLRRSLQSSDAAAASKFVEFYEEFGLVREVEAWKQQTTNSVNSLSKVHVDFAQNRLSDPR
jgi:tetratricopeptide (TPR) repeat protein